MRFIQGASFGVILVVVGFATAILGSGLWLGRSWARMIGIILFSLALVGSLIKVNVFFAIINALVVLYLTFSKSVKEYYKP